MPAKATWRSGYAAVCKTVYPGSIPGVASSKINNLQQHLISPTSRVREKSAQINAMTDSEKIEFLEGQVHALVGFATAVIFSHPNPTLFAQCLEKIGEVNLARAEADTVTDAYVDGVISIKTRLKSLAETALARQTHPKG